MLPILSLEKYGLKKGSKPVVASEDGDRIHSFFLFVDKKNSLFDRLFALSYVWSGRNMWVESETDIGNKELTDYHAIMFKSALNHEEVSWWFNNFYMEQAIKIFPTNPIPLLLFNPFTDVTLDVLNLTRQSYSDKSHVESYWNFRVSDTHKVLYSPYKNRLRKVFHSRKYHYEYKY